MTSKHSKRDAIHEEKKDDSMYSHGEVVSDDGDVEVALSPHSPEDGGDEVAPSTTPSASTTASAAAKEEPPSKSWCRKLIDFYNEYDFLILLIVVILLAYAYPPLGADYLQPQITATWIAVMFIFFISGLALRTEEFKYALKQLKFNIFVQVYGFGVVSATVFGLSRILIVTNALIVPLANGLVICSCLPMAINMVIILSKTADGDEGTAIFNSAFGNMLGVFLSPLLILGYLGVSGDVDLGEIFYKLVIRVVVPLLAGQLLQKLCPPIRDFSKTHSRALSKSQMYALLFIVYTVFCSTFEKGNKVPAGSIVVVIVVQLGMLSFMMLVAWYALKFMFPSEPRLRVTGVFGCTFKTVSLGVPLINAMYEGDENLALYILPLLIWYPLQLMIGSFLSPILRRYVQRETERLAAQGIVVAPASCDANDENGEELTIPNNTKTSPDGDETHVVVDEESPEAGTAAGEEKAM